MRILYHHRTQGEEPEAIHIAAIVDALRALGNEVLVVGPRPIRFSSDQKRRPTLFGKVKNIAPRMVFELMQLAYNIVIHMRLRSAVSAFSPDLIYERYALFSFAGLRLAKRSGIPLILEVNTPYAQAWAQYYGLTFKRFARWMEKRIFLNADHIVTVTEVQKQMLQREGVSPEAISVCHNAIDPDWFSQERQTVSSLVETVPAEKTVIGFVGTMNRWQGMDAFPKVMEQVLDACADAHFLLVGDGESRAGLEDFCHQNNMSNRVTFTRRQPHSEIPRLVARMDITVLLDSNAYGSPMKIFEYMAMGKAVVAPRIGPVMEVVEDGRTGLLIDAGSTGDMANEVIRLVKDADLRTRLGSTARQYVVANHTWRQNAMKIEQIYHALSLPIQPPGAAVAS